MKKIHSISFKHAWDGISYALTTQPNFRIHLALATVVILAGFLTHINPFEWIIIGLVITLGLVIEMINTAIESVVDLITAEWKVAAKHAKDVAAGAMLIYAIGAIFIAIWIFLPYYYL